ncbi:hypothetical protein ACET3Z_023720 [Daucus carota]
MFSSKNCYGIEKQVELASWNTVRLQFIRYADSLNQIFICVVVTLRETERERGGERAGSFSFPEHFRTRR